MTQRELSVTRTRRDNRDLRVTVSRQKAKIAMLEKQVLESKTRPHIAARRRATFKACDQNVMHGKVSCTCTRDEHEKVLEIQYQVCGAIFTAASFKKHYKIRGRGYTKKKRRVVQRHPA